MTRQRLSSSDSDAPSAAGTHLCSSIEFQEIAKQQSGKGDRERKRKRVDEGMQSTEYGP